MKLGKRSGLQCLLCFDQISDARMFSRTGQVPIADGVRCDGKQELKKIIDNLHSDAYNAARNTDETQRL